MQSADARSRNAGSSSGARMSLLLAHGLLWQTVADTKPRAADLVLRDARGFGHNTFKIDLARRAIIRALTQAARGTPQSISSKKIA